MKKILLSLQNINKYYGNLHVLKDFSLDIYEGEFLTLLGPSGCGKTTTLRAIAGLEPIESGEILLQGQSIVQLPPNERNVNTVFQNYALFPHLTVAENIKYGPKIKGLLTGEALEKEMADILHLVQMAGYEDRMPDQLSGGQMQRIAIGRALINKPDILLLDEPLGALDLKLRQHMQIELSNLQKQTGTTFIYVTHDQEEALNMSDRIVVMDKGILMQVGSPRDVYQDPSSLFVADFVGDRNLKNVKILKISEDGATVSFGNEEITVRCSENILCQMKIGDNATLALHTDKMKIVCDAYASKNTQAIKGTVRSVHYAGSQIRTELQVGEETLRVIEYINEDCDYQVGDDIYITWQATGAVLLPETPLKSATERKDII